MISPKDFMKDLSSHIEFEKLVERAERQSNFDEAQKIHLTECEKCASDWRRLENFFSTARIEPVEVPQFVTANLLNIFQKPKSNEKESLKKRLLGALVFDDWLPEFAVQERRSMLDARQLLYRAGDYEIDLRLTFDDRGECQLSGQIFPDCETGGKIKIFSEKTSVETNFDANCDFVLPLVPEGIYTLRLEISVSEIVIESISLLQ